jgi:patatin-related protein
MKQIEIRLALVLYGGVSLAIYMHGVTREILNLLRASKQFRAVSRLGVGDHAGIPPLKGASSAVYLELFEALAPHAELRVIVDVIAGASAGGINGVMLARAVAHDLSLDDHRDLWLRCADVTELSQPAPGFARLLKSRMAPVVDRMLGGALNAQTGDPETRDKLRAFVQARWFTPPFSGERFIGWMIDACDHMDEGAVAGETLLPRGHRLDLFVTLTDFLGRKRRIRIDDPAFIEETEHRRIVQFSCRHRHSGKFRSDFGTDDVPSLIFAARATSAFPGAFPPTTVAEMDRVLEARSRPWPGRGDFVTRRLGDGASLASGERAIFVDGSVVMNKPFAPVLETLGERPANREVVRRIVYVDPVPPGPDERSPEDAVVPGFFRTILASLAQIPRNEPIGDELKAIEDWNARARRVSEIIAAAEPAVERKVADIVRTDHQHPPTVDEVVRWRAEANEAAHAGAGYAYFAYQKLKIRSVTERLCTLIASLARRGGEEAERAITAVSIDVWLAAATPDTGPDAAVTPQRVIGFLRGLDVDYRIRRLRFVIRKLNELYRTADEEGQEQASGPIDDMKSTLYELIDELEQRWRPEYFDQEIAHLAATFATGANDDVAVLLGRLDAAMDLSRSDGVHDDVFSVMALNYLNPTMRSAVTNAYIGFAFYDLITFPLLQWSDLSEVNEVLVDRISPQDARGLRPDGVVLKGTALQTFGAFFNRSWREHDYLWGRLNAADRLVSIVLSAVGERLSATIHAGDLRRRLFEAILDEEESYLKADPELVASVRAELAARFPAG